MYDLKMCWHDCVCVFVCVCVCLCMSVCLYVGEAGFRLVEVKNQIHP